MMRRPTRSGFTMIETMLVLAVGGLLTVGLLVGAGVSIAQQRYKESATGLQAFIQDGYNLTVVTQNSRDSSWSCDQAGPADRGDISDGIWQGQSDCMVVGRLITVNEAGLMKNNSVIAYQTNSGIDKATSLTDAFSFYISDVDEIRQSIPWSGWIKNPISKSDRSEASILVLRSPITNIITTYSSFGLASSQTLNSKGSDALIQPANQQDALDMCLQTESRFYGQPLAVRVKAWAASPTSVMIPDGQEGVCDG